MTTPHGDARAKALSDAALICRQRRLHPTIDLISALMGTDPEKCTKTVEVGITRLVRVCLTPGCDVLVIDEYDSVGRKLYHDLKYPKDAEGNELYLLPKGTGRMHPEDAGMEIWARYGKAKRRRS